MAVVKLPNRRKRTTREESFREAADAFAEEFEPSAVIRREWFSAKLGDPADHLFMHFRRWLMKNRNIVIATAGHRDGTYVWVPEADVPSYAFERSTTRARKQLKNGIKMTQTVRSNSARQEAIDVANQLGEMAAQITAARRTWHRRPRDGD